ncbi:carboxymuconolactone decarboxylase family protein [Massilia glaciei]|uniref:carboxymuconolactone decarboxylase family protein n=1 Tax=Massilia glaciei TaxID=1524097 RepID=UPI001C62917C|nr:hypothetical protein [Massilia glaciei]
MRTCARCGSEYEWGVHVALFTKQATLSAADVAATLTNGPNDLPAHEAMLLKAADELHDSSTILDGLWSEMALHYSPAQIIELIALVGNYHAVSFIANAARVDLEPFAPRFNQA